MSGSTGPITADDDDDDDDGDVGFADSLVKVHTVSQQNVCWLSWTGILANKKHKNKSH